MGRYATDKEKHPSHGMRTGDRHRDKSWRRTYRTMKRGADQEFVSVDGEGVGDDYVLLDSSIDGYSPLYTGRRLETQEILDWLWTLGQHKDARGKDIVLFGAGYDYNNWMRAIDHTDVVKLAAAAPVRYRDYAVLWQRGYKFEIRKYGDTVNRVSHDAQGLIAWDAIPFWQSGFIEALKMTLGAVPDLITEGKAERGHFTHERIEWVSEYNKLECRLLVDMMRELVHWFHDAGIDLISWNGPGAAAKALLRQHRPYLHAGRQLTPGLTSSRDVGNYTHPSEISEAMLSAYAGGRNQIVQVGTVDEAYQADIISAYPYAMCYLPCLTHGQWRKVRSFAPNRFGLWRVRYSAVSNREWGIYPFFHRDSKDGSIHYPAIVGWRWAYTAEVKAALKHDREGVTIDYGWIWEPEECENPFPLSWLFQAFQQRKAYKAANKTGAATALKLALNSIYGSLAQAKGGLPDDPPWSQQLLWAGATTASIRARLYDAAMTKPWSVCHMATDGIISTEPLPIGYGLKLGEWELTELHDVTLIQYGVYFSREKGRSRGFYLGDNREDEQTFLAQVHHQWEHGGYEDVWYPVHYFVTAGLVANGLAPYDEWCTWKSRTEKLSTRIATPYESAERPKLGTLTRVQQEERWIDLLTEEIGSASYVPKWGKGMTFEEDEQDKAVEDGQNA